MKLEKDERFKQIVKTLSDNGLRNADRYVKILMEETGQEIKTAVEKERTNTECIAFCNCGDVLDRTGLYPNEATYHCMGCDETYILVTKDTKDVV